MKKSKKRAYSTLVEKGRKISWPSAVIGWKIGQRVYFSVKDNGLYVTTKPCGLYHGRILSTRLAKKFSSKHLKAT
jgi:hypothetical protein